MDSDDRSTRKDKLDKDAKKNENDVLDARLAKVKEAHEGIQRHKPTKK